jgi:fibronectin-binding autotransporter adhesin
VLLTTQLTQAATLYWDGNDTSGDANGGAGNWNNALLNWDTIATGGTSIAWSGGDTAIFGGTAGTVTLGANITVGDLQFNTTGYTISTGSNTLFLSGTSNILFNNIAAATITGTVGGAGNVVLSATNSFTAGTLTLNGTSAGGWSGTTTINPGMTLALADSNQALLNTTGGITLNGGGISLTNTNSTQGALDRVNSSAITSNGGTFTYTNTSGSGLTYAETIGSVGLVRGQTNFVLTNDMAGGGGNIQTLTLSDLTRTGATNTSVINFLAATTGPNATTNIIKVTGASGPGPSGSTASVAIIGPWATSGASNTTLDYAVYDGSGSVRGANISSTAENSGFWIAGNNVSNGGAITLTGSRTINTLRYTGANNTIALGGNTLATYGILAGGVGAPTFTATAGGMLTTPTGGDNTLYLTTGVRMDISAPINDNGSAVTVVKSGAGEFRPTSTTSTFSGGIVLNAGSLFITTDSNLGIGGGITVNGTVTINGGDQYNLARTLTLNEGASLTSNNGFGVTGVFSGNGALNVTSADDHNFTNAANTFTGAITSATSANTGYGLKFNSIGDTAGAGLITLVGGSGTFHWMSASGSTTTLANRQFAISGTGSGMISARGTTAASNLVINRDLLITGAAGARTLTLEGTNTGDNTFAGKITDGTDGGASVISLVKSNTGKWILFGANTYSGGTTLSAGTLVVSNASALGTGIVNVAGGTLESTVGTLSSNRFVSGGGSTITPSLGGSLGFTKFGTGTTNLNGTSNVFTGGVTVSGGTLVLGATGGLGQNLVGNSILIRDSGILTLAAAANSGSNQAITLSSSSRSLGPVSTTGGGAGPTGGLAVLGLGFNGLPNGAISQANTLGGVIAINGVTGYNTNLATLLTGNNLYVGAIGTSTFTGAAGTIVAGNGSLYRLGGGGGQITFNTTNLFTSTNGVQVGSTFTNGGGTVVVSAAQDYSGATTVSQGTLTLSGANGTATGSSGFTLNGGRLFLDSNASNNADRIGNVAATLTNGGELHFRGNAAGTTETMGDLNIGTGYSILTAEATTVASTLAAGAFSRTNNGTALFRGTALGQQTGATGRVTLTDTTGLSFSAGTTLNNAANGDTTKDVRIIPYLVGATAANGAGDSFVTYDTTLGFRVLNTANQFNSAITANTNVRLTAAATGITTNSINSLVITSGNSTIADGNTLTVASGAVLLTGGAMNAVATSGSGTLAFGANKGYITTTGNATIGALITGSNGLVKSGTAQLTLNNINNSFTGDIIVNAGTLSVANNNGVLGNAANNLIVNGHSTLSLGNTAYARSLELNNGAIATFNTESWTISGNVTGTGGVSVNSGGFSAGGTFSGTNNTFEGAVLIGGGGAGNLNFRMTFASLADSSTANGRIVFLGSTVNGATGSRFEYTGGTGGNTSLVLNNRQIELASTSSAAGLTTAGHQIMNSSAGTGTLTIATDLIVSTPIEQALNLRGINTGANTFSGIIGNGDGKVSLLKTDAGRWILSNANTFSGSTQVSGGTLELTNSLALQNSALDATNSITGTASAGLKTTVTTLTLGGLNGTKNLDALFTTALGGAGGTTAKGGYNDVTALTLNTGVGVTTAYSGAIINGASGMTLTKTGAGTQVLAGANTYTGATTVSQGTLIVKGSITSSSLTTVASGATIGGTGTIGALTVSSGGFISGGDSVDNTSILTINGAYNQAGLYTAHIADTGNFDQLNVSGAVNITGGSLTAMFTGGSYSNGDLIFILLSGSGITGEFTGFAHDTTVVSYGGFDWRISYTANSGTNSFLGGNDIALMAIPEPKTALLGCLGVLLLLRRRR